MPRLGFSEGAVGGAVKQAKPNCDSKATNFPCAGTRPKCKDFNLVTVEETSNQALRHFYMGTTVNDCSDYGSDYGCVGKANSAVPCVENSVE
jgi:hypothetical protein